MSKKGVAPAQRPVTQETWANQHSANPKQKLFIKLYTDPKSKIFGNAYQSALQAGYSEDYASQITAKFPDWLGENTRDEAMLQKAERNLNEVLDVETLVPVIGAFGPVKVKEDGKDTGEIVMHQDAKLLKIKTDTSMFVAERLNRKKYGKDKEDVKQATQVNVNIITYGQRQPAIQAEVIETKTVQQLPSVAGD